MPTENLEERMDVRIAAAVLRRAKKKAKREGRTLSGVVRDFLISWIDDKTQRKAA